LNPLQLINQVRRRLRDPLNQSPTPRQILDRAIDEYRNAVMRANNTGNAWAVKEFTITTLDNVRRYETTATDFSKALLVATVPSSTPGVVEPETALEFTQLEQLPRDWEFLAKMSSWSLWGWNIPQNARYAACYRSVETTGFKNYIEIRPTPDAGEQYRVLYQVGDFSGSIASDLSFNFPFPELDFYFQTLVCDGLLPMTRWSADEAADDSLMKKLGTQYLKDLARYEQTFMNFVASLSNTDIVYGESFADYAGLY
jgi:hypothetical protein